MAANLTTYDAILKENYAPAIVEQLNTKTILLKRLKRDSEALFGREFVIPVHAGFNEGVGARGENGPLPDAGKQQYKVAKYTPKYNWGQIAITEVVIKTTLKDKGAFVRALDSEVKGMANTMAMDINRQLFGDGTGLLAKCATNSTETNTIALDESTKMSNLRVGMKVDILVMADGTAVATNRTITAIDKINKKITIDGAAITTNTTHGVYRTGNYGKELNGLGNIINETGAVGGLNPANAGEEFWAATVLDNGGTLRSISETLMQQAFDAPSENSDGEVTLIIGGYGVRRAYQSLLTSLKRYVNTMDLEGGFTALEYNGKPFTVDKDAPPNTIFFIDENHLTLYELAKPQWMEEDGKILKWDGGTGYKAVFEYFSELGTDLRAAHAVLKDITEA